MNDDAMSRLLSGTGNNRRRSSGGFTIIETLIVLAVSGLLLVSAVTLVAGQQRKVEFSQAAMDIKSSIEQVISDVGAGFYANPGTFSCSVAGGNVSISAAAGTQQGSNNGCIFMGKAIQFGVQGTDPQQYVIHTVAGLQDNTGTLLSAKPVAVDLDSARDRRELRNGLRAVSMTYEEAGISRDIGAVAFVSSLGSRDSSDQLVSGNQQVMVVPVDNTGKVPDTTVAGAVSGINSQLRNAKPNPASGVRLCLTSGGGRSALITIGKDGSSLAVRLDYKNSGDCS